MASAFRPKAKIMFPNRWALNSFLLRLKRSSGWEYLASSDDAQVRVRPGGNGAEYILIGLSKASRGAGPLTVEINAEKLGHGADPVWIALYDFARRYRC